MVDDPLPVPDVETPLTKVEWVVVQEKVKKSSRGKEEVMVKVESPDICCGLEELVMKAELRVMPRTTSTTLLSDCCTISGLMCCSKSEDSAVISHSMVSNEEAMQVTNVLSVSSS